MSDHQELAAAGGPRSKKGLTMYTIQCDTPLTRRKRLHHILDAAGELVYSSAKIGPCIAWLALRGERQFYMKIDGEMIYPQFFVTITDYHVPKADLVDQPAA